MLKVIFSTIFSNLKDYPKQLRRISDFLGYDLTDETIAAIAEKGNVHTIKEELMQCKAMKDYAAKLSTDGTLPFYRKGKPNAIDEF